MINRIQCEQKANTSEHNLIYHAGRSQHEKKQLSCRGDRSFTLCRPALRPWPWGPVPIAVTAFMYSYKKYELPQERKYLANHHLKNRPDAALLNSFGLSLATRVPTQKCLTTRYELGHPDRWGLAKAYTAHKNVCRLSCAVRDRESSLYFGTAICTLSYKTVRIKLLEASVVRLSHINA